LINGKSPRNTSVKKLLGFNVAPLVQEFRSVLEEFLIVGSSFGIIFGNSANVILHLDSNISRRTFGGLPQPGRNETCAA
jgi:hypothetical protein